MACWGWNNYGQIGDGSYTDRHQPVPVTGLTDALVLDAGLTFNCAIVTGSDVMCWGNNGQGQLGASVGSGSTVPVLVTAF